MMEELGKIRAFDLPQVHRSAHDQHRQLVSRRAVRAQLSVSSLYVQTTRLPLLKSVEEQLLAA